MDSDLHSKRSHHVRFADVSFDSPCSHLLPAKPEPAFFRSTENSNAGNLNPIVHIACAFNPTAHQAALQINKDCLSLGQHVREDE